VKRTILYIAILLQLVAAMRAKAQVDPHFSQYYANPLWLNPALTGVFNGDARIGGNFKNQWSTINNAYRTGGLSADFKPGDKVGLGLNLFDQSAGNGSFNYFAAYGSFGYGIKVSPDGTKRLHFGLSAGIINRSFDPNKLQFGDQYNPFTGFDPTSPNFENFAATSAIVFDSSVGMYYYDGNPESVTNLFGGISLSHLTQSKDAFAVEGITSKIPIRLTVHGGVKIRANDFFDISPNAIFIKQQHNEIKAAGIYTETKVDDQKALVLALLYRWNDAVAATAGFHVNDLNIGFSYDINTSNLHRASNAQGGFELSISYVFGKGLNLPEPVCPRF